MVDLGDTAVLIWGIIFGSIGMGFVIYGKKQRAIVPLCVGIILCLVPYFIANVYGLVIAGIVLITIPFLVRM